MGSYKVIWKESEFFIKEEQRILADVFRDTGIFLDMPCGGKGSCGKCRVMVNGEERLACQTIVDQDMEVELPEKREEKILVAGSSKGVVPDGADDFVLAFDIGTTTVVGYLLDGKTGKVRYVVTTPILLMDDGAVVISRVQYTLKEKSGRLQKLILKALSELTFQAAEKASINTDRISLVCVVGNTCMHHLLLGIDPTPLTTPPYMPNVRKALELSAKDYFPVAESAALRVLPNIAGFVGADTVGCLSAVDFDSFEDWTLLVDIGTNGEMVLGKGKKRIACSTAAGPAFEGAKIECGMCGADGAIDHVWLENGEARCSVIGGGKAKGICGSGLLDAVAVFLKNGTINSRGRAKEKKLPLCDCVYITQKDIREVQLAKSAIRTGIELMAGHMGISMTDIQTVLLAGAFGNRLSPESACEIGLLPPVLLKKIQPIGNAAGEGAKRCALNREAFEKSRILAEETEFLELASMPEFQIEYINRLDFMEG